MPGIEMLYGKIFAYVMVVWKTYTVTNISIKKKQLIDICHLRLIVVFTIFDIFIYLTLFLLNGDLTHPIWG